LQRHGCSHQHSKRDLSLAPLRATALREAADSRGELIDYRRIDCSILSQNDAHRWQVRANLRLPQRTCQSTARLLRILLHLPLEIVRVLLLLTLLRPHRAGL
jgi:hypothetical protein